MLDTTSGRRRALGLALAAAVGFAALPADAQTRTRLTVYTALENDQLAPFKQAIERDVPDIEVNWVRDSTGVITARFLAERANPRADLVYGLAASSIMLFEGQGLLEPYTPKGADALKPSFRSDKSPMGWVGMDAFLAVVCFNTVEGRKANATAPASWQDLLAPAFKGRLVMPNPASSGTGFLTIAAWLTLMGEQAGWAFMDKLHENIAVYTHSGSAPCVQAARGEQLAGIGFDMRGAREKTQGAPIDLVLPREGAGWELEAAAIVKGSRNVDAAKKLMDWTVTKGANELFGKYYALVAHPDVKAAPPNYPANAEAGMAKMDFAWMAANRERVLAEWTKRYDGKSAPR
jgi:iron(III) transport system substrate-binding protein